MKTKLILCTIAASLMIPLAASAEPILVEATEHPASGKPQTSTFVLELTGDRPAELRVDSAAAHFEIKLRRSKAGAPIAYTVGVQKKGGRFRLSSAKKLVPGKRAILGSFRRPGGSRLEIAATLR